MACIDHKGNIDATMYQALHTTIDLAGLADILEMRDFYASWNAADARNAKEAQG